MRRFWIALGTGLGLTFGLLGLAFLAGACDMDALARTLFWQNTLLQSLVPLGNIGTPEHPVYEGSPLNFLALLASIPVGIFVYAVLSWIVLGWKGGRRG